MPRSRFFRLWPIAVVCFIAGVTARSQSVPSQSAWTNRVWQVNDGLPDNRVTGVVQSSDGYLWVATRGGLVRFNGLTFEKFDLTAVEGVIGNGVRVMFADTAGNLWVGGYREKIMRVSGDSVQMYSAADGMPTAQFSAFADDGKGGVWLAFGSHLCALEGGRLREITLPESQGANGAVALACDTQGRVWCARYGHVGILAGGQFEERFRLEDAEVELTAARGGGLWACVGSRIFRLRDDAPALASADLPLEIHVLSLLEDRAGGLWIGTASNGLFRFAEGSVEKVETSHQQIATLLEDREGSVWVGTFGGGLDRLRPRVLDLIGPRLGLPFEAVTSVTQDSGGDFWAVGGTGQLAHGNGKVWKVVPEGGGSAVAVAADRQGRIWVATKGKGLREFYPSSGRIRVWQQSDGLPSNTLRCVFVDRDDSLWFATDGPTRLCKLSGGVLRTWPVVEATRNIRAIIQDARGVIWVGTSDGQVLQVAGDNLVGDPAFAASPLNSVRCLGATPDGSLWIGYGDRGLGVFKDGHYVRLTTATGLVDDAICQIAVDRTGSLWLAGGRGLARVAVDAALAVAEGRATTLNSTLYGREEGLPNMQPHYDNSPVVCQSPDGTISFSTSLGLLVLHPVNLRDNPVPPPVILERAMIDDQLVGVRSSRFPFRGPAFARMFELAEPGKSLLVAPEHRKLAFDFAALSYSAPENVRYRYRLDGLDETWTEPGRQRTAQYSRLPAGDYVFRVTASNDAGVWSKEGAVLAITVRPFYWQTWWFRFGLLGIFTSSIVAVVRWASFRRLRVKLQQAEQQSALYKERARIARDIHDELGGVLTHIKLRSELAVRDRDSTDPADEHMRQITGATQKMLTSLDEIVWAINPGNDTLPHLISYLGQHAVEFLRTAGIRCVLDLPENPPEIGVTPEVRHHLLLVVKEALNNVVRHAGAHAVSIQIKMDDGWLHVVIEDDGRGLTLAPADSQGNGLRNMQERMAAAGGRFQVENKSNTGTRLHFAVPVGQPT